MRVSRSKHTVFIPLLVLAALGSPTAAQEGDAAAGEKLYRRCVVCHDPRADESKRGPSLAGVVGRQAAADPDYPYSEAMRAAAAGGLVWDEEALRAFIKRPRATIKGTWMAFPGLPREKDLSDLIAYLKRHSD